MITFTTWTEDLEISKKKRVKARFCKADNPQIFEIVLPDTYGYHNSVLIPVKDLLKMIKEVEDENIL